MFDASNQPSDVFSFSHSYNLKTMILEENMIRFSPYRGDGALECIKLNNNYTYSGAQCFPCLASPLNGALLMLVQ